MISKLIRDYIEASPKFRSEYVSIKSFIARSSSGAPIGISATKDHRYLLTVLACLELGVPYVPLNKGTPALQEELIRNEAGISLMITDEVMTTALTSTAQDFIPAEPPLDAIAYVIFTSGTTGKPKGVVIERSALENFFAWVKSEFSFLTSRDRLLQVTNFSFDISLTDVAILLHFRPEIYFSEFSGNFFRLADEIERYQISVLSTVPNNISVLLSETILSRANVKGLRTLLLAGSPLTVSLKERIFQELGGDLRLYNLYGPTECTVYSHAKKITPDMPTISIGKPLPHVESLIHNGELCLSGAQLFREYLHDLKLTGEKMVELNGKKYFRTGDLASVSGGDYFVTGRIDDTIKVRGVRVNLTDLDHYIASLPYVTQCATVAVPDEIATHKVVAFLRLEQSKTVEEIYGDMKKILQENQLPDRIIVLPALPVGSSGKIDKQELRKLFKDHHEQK